MLLFIIQDIARSLLKQIIKQANVIIMVVIGAAIKIVPRTAPVPISKNMNHPHPLLVSTK